MKKEELLERYYQLIYTIEDYNSNIQDLTPEEHQELERLRLERDEIEKLI